jgi:hypothetical protein
VQLLVALVFTRVGNRFGPEKLVYADKDDGTQKGCIDLAGAKWNVHPKNPCMFEIVTPKRTYQLIAATKADTRCWLAKLSHRDEHNVHQAYMDPVTGQMTQRVNPRKQEMLDMVLQAESRASQSRSQVLTELEPEPVLEQEPALETGPRLEFEPDAQHLRAVDAGVRTSSTPASSCSDHEGTLGPARLASHEGSLEPTRLASGMRVDLGLPPVSTSPKPTSDDTDTSSMSLSSSVSADPFQNQPNGSSTNL